MSIPSKQTRGSEWRVWDIHAHTPASHGYSGSFDEFITNAKTSPAKVIGVNDYCTLDGYSELVHRGGIPGKTLFPVIEFRMHNIIANRKNVDPTKRGVKINFHVIFDNDPSLFHEIQIWRDSLHCYDDDGRRRNLGTATDLRNLTFDYETVLDSLDQIGLLNHHALVWLPYDEYGGIDDIDPKDNFFKLHLINRAHFMGSGSPKQIEFFKWSDKTFSREQFESWFDNPKPCIKGSDAHKATYPLGHLMDGESNPIERFCWVNAEPTFDGLKQVVNEPDRVYIGDRPELLKRLDENPTKFVKSLTLERLTNPPFTDLWFQDFSIEFNAGLVAIIGNKGNGKSAITDILALCGNTHQDVDDFSFLTKHKFRSAKPKNFSEYFLASLNWHFGTPSTKLLCDDPDRSDPERVKYIPQKLLEKLCTNIESEEFKAELEKIIYSHIEPEDRLGFDSLESLIKHKSALVQDQIDRKLRDLSDVNEEIQEFEIQASQEHRKSIAGELELKRNEFRGHLRGKPAKPVSDELEGPSEAIGARITEVRQSISTAEGTIADATKKRSKQKIALDALTAAQEWYQNLKSELEGYKEVYNVHVQTLDAHSIKLDDVFTFTINVAPIEEAMRAVTTSLEATTKVFNKKIAGTTAFELEGLRKRLVELQDKLDLPARLRQSHLDRHLEWKAKARDIVGHSSSEGSIKFLKRKLRYIDRELPRKLYESFEKRHTVVTEIILLRSKLKDVRKELYSPVTALIHDNEDLKKTYPMRMDVSFETPRLSEEFFSHVSKGKVGSFYGDDKGQQKLNSIIDKTDFESESGILDFLKEISYALAHDTRTSSNDSTVLAEQLRQNASLAGFYDFLYGLDYLDPSYTLKLGDKAVVQLSPGERGALLLIFYLSLDREDIPLLIDQPEDNLDNESIYHDLVCLIKKAKTRRQIIMVTHNPNLALGCDAEQIIKVHIDKENGNLVSFESGGIEDYNINKSSVDILEGTLRAFDSRGAKWVRKPAPPDDKHETDAKPNPKLSPQ
jgi:predicted ATPase